MERTPYSSRQVPDNGVGCSKPTAAAAEQLLVAEGLPILCRWLAKTQSEENVWRGTEHMMSFGIQDGRLRYSDQ